MIRKASLLLAGVALGAIVAVTATQTRLLSGSAANAAAADTYRELNLFGDVFERFDGRDQHRQRLVARTSFDFVDA